MARQTSAGPYSVTTTPSLITCRACGRPVMAATIAGLDRHLDTAMLNQLGELNALLERRATFNLCNDRLWKRNQSHIRAGRSTYPVLAEHACKDVPREHIDSAWMEAATAIVIHAVGGVIVSFEDPTALPPF